ncbi:MAG: phage portal protein [Catenulispora sp.]|nr:phage portal protein [Catenulispora sp.]
MRRAGFEYGTVLAAGASVQAQVAAGQERLDTLDQLYQAYLTCPWVSAPIDVIARTVTAGGFQVVTDDDLPEGAHPAEPPGVERLRRLLRFVNPREDMIQLIRSSIIDLELFGDSYIEKVMLLGEVVALYTLDATTITVLTDEHGEVSGYQQTVNGAGGQRHVTFTPDQVIHISLDAPRGGVYGVSPAQRALLPVTAWLFTEATLKECFRRGDPPRLRVDLGHAGDADVQRWREQYQVYNLGPKAVGTPVITTGGGPVDVLDVRRVTDYLDASRQLRDEILACFGVPPAKVGIIETGNLGSGSGESQDKTFRINTVVPIANLVLEKLNFHLVQQGFGITGWHLEFAEVDYRDSKVIEDIRDTRLRNGSWTLNTYRGEIGQPPVEGGDDPVLVDRQNLVLWADMARMSEAVISKNAAPAVAAGVDVPGVALQPPPAAQPVPPGGPVQSPPGEDPPLPPGDDPATPEETAPPLTTVP